MSGHQPPYPGHPYNQTEQAYFNIKECLNRIIEANKNFSIQDCVNHYIDVCNSAIANYKMIIDKIMPRGTNNGNYITNNIYTYCTSTNQFHTKGQWEIRNGYSTFNGFSVITLIKYHLRYDEFQTFNVLASHLQKNISDRKELNYAENEIWEFIPAPSNYRVPFPNEPNSLTELLGLASEIYTFTINHKPSFYMNEWNIQNEIVRLFCTFALNRITNEYKWLPLEPPPHYLIFNRDFIEKHKNLHVVIFDQITKARKNEHIFVKENQQYAATWSGDLSIHEKLDWSFLEGRNVAYIFDRENKDSMIIGSLLIGKFKKFNTELKLFYTN